MLSNAMYVRRFPQLAKRNERDGGKAKARKRKMSCLACVVHDMCVLQPTQTVHRHKLYMQ